MLTRRDAVLSLAAAGMVLPGAAPALTGIKMRQLYNEDLSFSDLALSLDGTRVQVYGFMAPTLKADAKFFVLTKRPMAICPFCDSEASWPDDILVIYTKRPVMMLPFYNVIETNGVLELGTYNDPETGFVSRVRITDATYKIAEV